MTGTTTDDLAHIQDGLRSLAVPIDSLTPDPANARRHDAKNLDAIRGSLRQYGQRQPIVVQKQGLVIRAGNGRWQAAKELGWEFIAALVVDEDNVSAVSYAITDNRSGELASWDEEALAELMRQVEVADHDLQQMIADMGDSLKLLSAESPDEFKEVGDDIETNHECPKCHYQWSE